MAEEPRPPAASPSRLVSARLRIVAWLLLVTSAAVAVVVLTTRAALLAGVREEANAEIVQENEEFRSFATGVGVDPETGRPFTSAERLLSVYLARQFPGEDEVLVGVVRGAGGLRPVVQQRDASYDLVEDRELLRRLVEAPSPSGTLETPAGEVRWGRVEVQPAEPGEDAAVLVIAQFLGEDLAEAQEVVARVAGLSALGLVLAGVVAWFVAGQILAPVRTVREAAASITEEDLTRRIPVRGRDDIAALAAQFNMMLDRLEEAFGAQRDFLDDAAHELRTPITVVRGHLELMGEDPREREAVLRLVDDELDRMNRLVTDLLLLAKARRPDFVRPAETDLVPLVVELEAKVQALGERDWRLEHVADGTAVLDPQRVTQALLQLASNAVQHTRAGDEIRLGSRYVGDRVRFWVHDSGPGVAEEDVARIFERFARGGSAQMTPGEFGSHRSAAEAERAERPGTGLGLAIVKAIAEAHAGRVFVAPAEHGALFVLELPVGPAAGPRHEEPPAEPAEPAERAEPAEPPEPPPGSQARSRQSGPTRTPTSAGAEGAS